MAVALNSPRPHDGARGHPAFTAYHYDLAHEVRAATVACRQPEPAGQVNPTAVAAMAEMGIDITANAPTLLTGGQVQSSDVVITMGCGDACPYFPGVSYRNWKLPDPAGQPLDVVRMIRDDIADRVQALIAELLATAKTR